MFDLAQKIFTLMYLSIAVAKNQKLNNDEKTLLGKTFKAIPMVNAAMARHAEEGPVQANVLLIVESFAAALNRYHPKAIENTRLDVLQDALLPKSQNKFPKYVEDIFTEQLERNFGMPEDFGDLYDAEILSQWTGSPMDTPIYRALWAAFAKNTWHLRIEAQQENVLYRLLGVQTETALMTLEDTQGTKTPLDDFLIDIDGTKQGMGKRRFEALFQIEYVKRLGSEHITEQEALITQRRLLYQEAIIKDMASWDENHVFGNIDRQTYEDSGDEFIPFLPLAQMYVEPKKGFVDDLLQREDKVVAVSAHFGMGKSLTSRMLAIKLAQDYLEKGHDAPIPIYIECQKSLKETNIAGLFGKGYLDALKTLGIDISARDKSLPQFDHRRRYHLLLDGLDEVNLQEDFLKSLLINIEDMFGAHSRCTIFSRPYALKSVLNETKIYEIQSYSEEQVTQWTDRWNDITNDALENRQFNEVLKDGDRVPILLFMYATVLRKGKSNYRDKTAIYEDFIRVIASGKFTINTSDHSPTHQPIQNAQTVLRERLDLTDEVLDEQPNQNKPDPEPMVWLFSQIAWIKHCIDWNQDNLNISVEIDKMIQNKLNLHSVKSCLPGSIIALQTDGKLNNILFKHRSFQEFLCAKRWEYALRKLNQSNYTSPNLDQDLFGAPIAREGENSTKFLFDLVHRRWINNESTKKQLLTHTIATMESIKFQTKSGQTPIHLREDASWHPKRVLFQVACWLSIKQDDDPVWYEPNMDVFWTFNCRENIERVGHLILPMIDFSGQNLRNADLHKAELYRAKFHKTHLYQVDLKAAVLCRASFKEAGMFDASLIAANMGNASFEKTYLIGANLTSANLKGADLHTAYLNEAFFKQTWYNKSTRWPDNFDPTQHTGLRLPL